MIIIGPYARAGFTDSTVAGMQLSMQAFIERIFGLAPLTSRDAEAYDYLDSFDFSQSPRPPIKLTDTPIPAWKIRYGLTHGQELGAPDD